MNGQAGNEPPWIEEVLSYWFAELQPQAWFNNDPRVDEEIRRHFGGLYQRLRFIDPESATRSPRAALASVIMLDQFPRNMFRGTPDAFATDATALEIAEYAIARGLDRELAEPQKPFLYMPFQHSERSDIQARSVELFAALGNLEVLDYARRHKDLIDRFGRFPHRNDILRRPTTEQEREFLKTNPGV